MRERDVQGENRELVIQAAGQWIDQWPAEDGGGGVITGWVLAIESVTVDGTIFTTFCSGNGDPVESDRAGGIEPHRMEGILHDVLRWVDVRERRRMTKLQEGE